MDNTDSRIRFSEVELRHLVMHKVGNKGEAEGVHIANGMLPVDEDLREILLGYFLGSFKQEEWYRFSHDTDLNMNEVYAYCQYIFEEAETAFYQQSTHIAKHLYEKSEHSRIRGGELYVAYFEQVLLDDELVDAIGVFKAENKDVYIKLKSTEENDWRLEHEQGTSTAKLDKGCLIFNTAKEDGYRVISVDLKGGDAKYWRDEFLQMTQLQDDNFHTKNYMSMCKSYGKEAFKDEDKNEQVAFINRSLTYFDSNDEFDFEDFKTNVFGDEQKAFEFEDYANDYQHKQGIEPEEHFSIAPSAVKKMRRSLRSVIQLDTQIEIKVNSVEAQDEGFLERGYDHEKEMHYYKVFFNKEK